MFSREGLARLGAVRAPVFHPSHVTDSLCSVTPGGNTLSNSLSHHLQRNSVLTERTLITFALKELRMKKWKLYHLGASKHLNSKSALIVSCLLWSYIYS
jgi:hypothetical protein